MYPNLKLEIFKRRIQQNHLAKAVGMKEANLSKIIHGYRNPSQAQRRLLAEYLAVDENWLFDKFEGTAPAANSRGQESSQE
jgi:transcriptional regulator with XRE-family HTH domain